MPVLRGDHYLRFRGTLADVGRRAGWNAAVWVGDVDLGDDRATLCAVKMAAAKGHGLLNEVIGFALAKLAGVPAPDQAAVLLLDWDQIPARHHAALRAVHGAVERVPAWATTWVMGDVLDADRSAAQRDLVMTALLASPDGERLAAFDHWVANTDRHGGNIVRVARERYTAIDHEHIVFGPLWPDHLQEVAVTTTLIHESRRLLPDDRRKSFGSAALEALDLIAVRLSAFADVPLPAVAREALSADAQAFLVRTLRARLQSQSMASLLGMLG